MWWLRVSDVCTRLLLLVYYSQHFVVPSPGVEASANATGPIFAGTVLTLTCTVALDGVLSGMFNDPSVTTVWTQDGQEVSTGSNITVSGATITVGTTYSSTLSFNTVHADDAGDYTCTATVSPSVPSGTVTNGVGSSDQVTVSVNGKIRQGLSNQSTHVRIYTPSTKINWEYKLYYLINLI